MGPRIVRTDSAIGINSKIESKRLSTRPLRGRGPSSSRVPTSPPSLRGKDPSRRGEGGEECGARKIRGIFTRPLWSPAPRDTPTSQAIETSSRDTEKVKKVRKVKILG